MALIQWKQLDTLLSDTVYTGSLNVTGSLILNGIDLSVDSSIFQQTGSYWNTTRNIGITGSFALNLDGISDILSVSVQGEEKIKVTTEGIAQFVSQSITPTPVEGGIFYSASDAFFLGFKN